MKHKSQEKTKRPAATGRDTSSSCMESEDVGPSFSSLYDSNSSSKVFHVNSKEIDKMWLKADSTIAKKTIEESTFRKLQLKVNRWIDEKLEEIGRV